MILVKLYRNYINGEFKETTNNDTFFSNNPYRPSEILGEFVNADQADVNLSIQTSLEAFKIWSKVPAPARVEIIERAVQSIANHKEKIAHLMTIEQGKPMHESLGEVNKAISESRFMIGEGLRLYGITAPSEKENSWSKTIRVPIGPIAAITPWNFPVLTPLRKIIPALIAGNTVVLKPSELTPLTGLKIVELMNLIDLPKGVLNAINGGKNTGQWLVEHSAIKGIAFTGSTNVGLAINNIASRRMVRVQAEMGGKNPVIIWDYVQIQSALKEVIGAAFACSGQRCTAISRIIVPTNQSEEVEQLLKDEISKVKLGNGLEENITMGPLISVSQLDRVDKMVKEAIEEGAELVVGGKRIEEAEGYLYEPTLLTKVNRGMKIAREEVFGPVLSLISVDTFEEAIKIANDTDYGLSAAIYSDSLSLVGKFVDTIESGMIHVNHGTAPESHMPFGGLKQSGIGESSVGIKTKDFFTDIKTVYIKYS